MTTTETVLQTGAREAVEEELADQHVKELARSALDEVAPGPVWQAIDMGMTWIQDTLSEFFINKVATLPHVGKWASRIGATISGFIITVLKAFFTFLRIAMTSPTLWTTMHNAAMRAWDCNLGNGLLAQTYAYAKKMTAYVLETLMQCFERAIRAQNLEVTENERNEIHDVLETLFNKKSKSIESLSQDQTLSN